VPRRFALWNDIGPRFGAAALDDLSGFPMTRYGHAKLMSRVWDPRDNLTA
jgi:hypothetical protein